MYQRAVILLGIVGTVVSLILGLLLVIAWQIVAVLIAISIGIPSLILRYEKPKSEVSAEPQKGRREQEQREGSTTGFRTHSVTGFRTDSVKQQKEILRKETILVSPTAGYSYEFEFSRGDHVKGEMSSTAPIDIYFLDYINFDKWDRDKSFEAEDCNEGVLETSIDYEATRKGIWYIVIENNGRKSATVKVNLSVEEGGSSEFLFPCV